MGGKICQAISQSRYKSNSPRILFTTEYFKDKKNWLSFTTSLMVVVFGVFLSFFIFKYFSIKLLIMAFLYSTVIMGSHGTVW
jgi:hypothetical protein